MATALVKAGKGRQYYLAPPSLNASPPSDHFFDLKEYEIASQNEQGDCWLRPYSGASRSWYFAASDIIVNPTPQDLQEQCDIARKGIGAFEKFKAGFIRDSKPPAE